MMMAMTISVFYDTNSRKILQVRSRRSQAVVLGCDKGSKETWLAKGLTRLRMAFRKWQIQSHARFSIIDP
jgi:hypothetical protein